MTPETFDFIASFAALARARGIEVLVEVHSHYRTAAGDRRARRLGLRLRAAAAGAARPVHRRRRRAHPVVAGVRPTQRHYRARHARRHRRDRRRSGPDGRPGAPGLLTTRRSTRWSQAIPPHSRRHEPAGHAAPPPQTSTSTRSTAPSTTRSAATTTRYLLARAVQLFLPGVPQIYYVGLLAGGNDVDTARRAPASAATSTGTATRRRRWTRRSSSRPCAGCSS